MHSNEDLVGLLKNNGYKKEFIDFIFKLNDKDFQCVKNDFCNNANLLTAMSKKKYNSANEYILNKFYNIKTHNGEYSFLKDKNSIDFKSYKEFIIVLLNQGFNDNHLLQILNQFSFCVDQVKKGYSLYCPNSPTEYVHVYQSRMYVNELFLKYQDVFITFFSVFPSHSRKYNDACKALINIDSKQLDKYKSNLPLFRFLAQNGFSSEAIEKKYTVQVSNCHYNKIRLNVVGDLFNMDDFKKIKIKNNEELLDLLLKKDLITLDEKDFIAKNPIVSYFLKTNKITISELIGGQFEECKRKVEKIEAQIKLLNTHYTTAPGLIEQVMEQVKYNQHGVQSLLTLSIAALKTPQKRQILESPQVEEVNATQNIASSRCNIL